MEKRYFAIHVESRKHTEAYSAALTQSVELILDVLERFATVPNGPVADRVTSKLKAVFDKNPVFYVLKQVSNVLSGADSKIPGLTLRAGPLFQGTAGHSNSPDLTDDRWLPAGFPMSDRQVAPPTTAHVFVVYTQSRLTL
ncbi:hypothetical protein HPB50_000856 [Hyalomma asiaticum]|uniref:Uncharacterized protein n=1 Tax=Hyalomma asiaticum TaxID=266040 RepID=A0ACB7SDL1_HYAAI|nr:hypothetical protein HPB50_000856 [Hyalomma asiaticum]